MKLIENMEEYFLCFLFFVRNVCKRSHHPLRNAGIIQVNGSFGRGDTISIHDSQQKELARGIVRYTSQDLARLQGCQSKDIEAHLGYAYGPVAVHRNDLILV